MGYRTTGDDHNNFPPREHTRFCHENSGYGGCVCLQGNRRALFLKNDWDLALAKAKTKGCYIAYPETNQLFIDIDTPEQLKRFAARLPLITRLGCRYDIEIKRSENEGHYHIVLGLPFKMGRFLRIILQWFFGSDPKREWLSFRRLCAGSQTPTIFFEKVPNGGGYR